MDIKKKASVILDSASDKIKGIKDSQAFDKAKDIAEDVKEKTGVLIEASKKKLAIEKLDYQISKKYIQLGKAIYASYEEKGSYEGVGGDICKDIDDLFDQIIELKSDLDKSEEEIKEEVNQIVENVELKEE